MTLHATAGVAPSNGASAEPLLAAASRRLRRRPGRPRTVTAPEALGGSIRGTSPATAENAAKTSDFATSLPPQGWGRGLPLPTAAAYSGVPMRRLWALIADGTLPVVRVPGMRAVLVLRDDLDALLLAHRGTHAGAPEAARRPS